MKRILTAALCLILLLGTAQAAEYYYINPDGGQFIHAWPDCPAIAERYRHKLLSFTMYEMSLSPYGDMDLEFCPFCMNDARTKTAYYVNPDGGRFYHEDRRCPSISEAYWSGMVLVYEEELSQEPYADLRPCSFCVTEKEANPWVAGFNTARDVRIDAPGTYRTDAELNPGLYTVVTDGQCDGVLLISRIDGTVIHEFLIRGEASYSFYLWDNTCVTMPEHAVLTPIVKQRLFSDQAAPETIRQARRMLYYEMQPRVYAASSIEGEDGYIALSSIDTEIGQGKPTVIPLPAGETVTFDTDMDGVNDPMKLKYFDDPTGEAYFVEFVNCVVWPVDTGE